MCRPCRSWWRESSTAFYCKVRLRSRELREIDIADKLAPCPKHIAIVGGGRWARVIVGELCRLTPPAVVLSVHSRSQAGAMASWAQEHGLEHRLDVSAAMPGQGVGAVIVANAAADHAAAVEHALEARIPVLVEKPIATIAAAARRLATLAGERNAKFAAAHVFLFARYVDRYAAALAAAGPLKSLHAVWTDPVEEVRHGERKSFDSGLPIQVDILPHLVSIAGRVTGRLPDAIRRMTVERGGDAATLGLHLGEASCEWRLERRSDGRRRMLRAVAGGREVTLDFSREPGTITQPGSATDGDPLWDDPGARRPLASMLVAFLAWAGGGPGDARLSVEPGLRALELAEAVETVR